MDYKKAIAYTLIVVGFFYNAIGALTLGMLTYINWEILPVLLLGSLMGGYFGASIAINPGGEGDVTSKRIWRDLRSKKNRLGTPVIRNGYAYFVNMSGFAECLDMKTGEIIFEERLTSTGNNSAAWASPILVDDKVYVTNQSGDTNIFRAAPKFELLATNSVEEYSNSTLAVSDGSLYLRTHKSLWCISE